MYYSAGTYEAFARPEKPEGADRKSAYIIGTGLAGLSAAFYLVRDGQVKGERIHLLEKLDLAGGSCDGRKDVRKGFYMRGGREMDNHFECMWDMFRDVPSIETPGVSVLDEYYWLNEDSTDNWYLSWTINRQPQFKAQDKNTVLIWVYALTTNKEGNYVKKAMRDCTGEEVCREWLYHIGVPTDQIDDWAKNRCNTTTCFMPYINAFFQPRKESDRPLVVPEGAVNFAFLGQFAETPRDTIFTTEYSIRTGMEAVYTLMNVDRGVPEVWGSKYDVRELLRAAYYAVDKKPIDELPLSLKEKVILKKVIKSVEGTDLEILLKESGLLR